MSLTEQRISSNLISQYYLTFSLSWVHASLCSILHVVLVAVLLAILRQPLVIIAPGPGIRHLVLGVSSAQSRAGPRGGGGHGVNT